MKNLTSTFLLFSLLLVASGCVTTDVIRLSNASYPRIAPQNIRVYLSGNEIKYDYENLALILAETELDLQGYEEIVEKAKQEAAEIGANAIILQKIGEASTFSKDSDEGLEISSEKRVKIIAIRVFKKDLEEKN